MPSAAPSLLAACADPRLIGLPLWPAQRAMLADVEDQRLHVWRCGRRSGKSTAAAACLVWDSALRDLRHLVLPGEARHSVAVATSLRQARLIVAAATAIMERSELLAPLIASVAEDTIVLRNGNIISAFPCGSRSARGWGISALVFDEMAHHVDSEGNSAAESMWQALSPSTLQFGAAARIICSSTPSGSGGFFAELFGQVESGEVAGAAHHFSTAAANPTVDEGFLQAQRAALGEEAFRQEFGGEFVSGSGSFFDAAEVRAVIGGRGTMPSDGRGWVCALDPSSGGGDPFACVVVGRDERPGFEGRLIAAHVERWLPRKGGRFARRSRGERDLWVDTVLDKVAAIAKRFGASVICDQHIPQVIVDSLRERGIVSVKVVPWTAPSRNNAFQSLRARVASERITIPDDDQLVSEMLRVRTRLRAGASMIEVGRVGDSHGDLCVALAAAVGQLDAGGAGAPLRTASATKHKAARPLTDEDVERLFGVTTVTNAREAQAADGTRVSVAAGRRPWRRKGGWGR